MEQSNFWLQFNNGKKINLSEIHDGINIDENNEFLKKYDKNSNSIFDKDEIEKLKEDAASYLADGVLDKREMVSWFAKLFGFSVESLKTDNEAKNRSMSDISDLVENSINDIANRSAQADCVEYLKSNSLNMTTDMLTRDNGIITELYDKIKNKCDDSLSPNYIYSIIFSEVLSAQFLEEANNGELTKQDYIERKINAAKAMMMHKIMGEYFESEFADLDVPREQLEKVIRQYLDFNLPHLVEYAAYNYDSEQGNVYDGISWGVNNLVERILKDEEFEKKFFKNISCSIIQDISKITSSGNSATVDKQGYDLSQVSIIPHVNYGEDELLNFEQTFKLEKGMDFNSEAYQEFQEAKSEMERVMAPFNKMSIMNSQIEDVREDLQKSIACNPHSAAFDKVTDAMDKSGDVPKAEDKIQKICNLFNEYYANNAEQAANDLNNIIQSKKIYGLRIGIAGNNLNISFTKQLNTDSDKLYALIQVLDAFEETMARRFESILGGKSLESYMNDYNSKQKNALGNTNMETLIDAYKADNGTVVQKYTGAVKTTGMVATFVGGVLCLSPAAGVGVGLVTAGGKMAIGGMAADYALEYTEALTRDEISKEELEDITKYCLMDAGGFIVGFKAGQKGNQAFAKLLDKKLASVLKQEITAGNRIKALKTVLSQKTLLKNFMSAEGAKMGTDFFISYVGDLVMMGVLDTDDNWESLLKQNLLGIVIGSSNDLADVGKLTVASQQRYRELKQKQNKSILNDAELKELAALEKERVNGKTKENTEQQIEADNKPDGQKPQMGLVDKIRGKSTRKADVSGKTEISVDKIQIKELTDEEFNVIKEKLFSKMEEIEPLKKIDKNEVNKYNCQILEYITEHPELLENKNFADNVGNIINYSFSPDRAKVALETFKHPELWNNKNFADNAWNIIYSSSSPDMAQSITFMIDKIADIQKNNPELWNNKNFADNVGNIIYKPDSPDSAKSIISMIDKIADIQKNNPDLWNNKNFADNVGNIIYNSNSPDRAQVALETFKHPELWNNKNFADNVGYIIYYSSSPDRAKSIISVIDKIADIQKNNPELWNNKNFADNVGNIIYKPDSPDSAKSIISMIDKIADIQKNNPDLWNNKNFADNVGNIIYNSNSPDRAQVALETFKHPELWNNKNFADNAWNIIDDSSSPDRAQSITSMINKITDIQKNNPELWNNENFKANVGYIIYCSSPPDRAQSITSMINKITDIQKNNKELWNNENFKANVGNIIYCSSSPYRAQSITSMINKITDIQKNNKELWNNKNFADNVGDIIYASDTPAKVKLAEKLLTDKEFPKEIISKVLIAIDKKGTNLNYALELCQNYKQIELTPNKIPIMIQNAGKISPKQIQKLNHIMGRDKVSKLSDSDFILACNFADIYKKNNINEIPASGKKALLRSLVASKDGLFNISDELSKDFPLIPKNQEEYCSLLPSIVRSLGIETSPLTPEQRIAMFNSSMKDLSLSVAKLSDVDFANLQITQDIPKDEFTKIVLEKVKDLSSAEKQKVYDYFGFELHHNKDNTQTGYSITGYPVNLNNGKKLAQITDSKTKAVIEDLRPEVIRFSKENPIRCNNPEVEAMLNQIVDALPELRTTIGRAQHGNNGTKGAHDFDVMKHSLKVMQKITQDSQFAKLNESDQKIMLLASLMHDITKAEGKPDKTHANESSFDSFFIAKKFNLTKEEEIKLYTLIRHHEWLEYVNTAKSEEQLTKRLQSVAYDLRQDNLFDMALMFTHADLRAVKADDSFHDRVDGKSRVDFKGSLRSFGQSADLYAKRIRECIKELQKSQPILPVTKFPKADRISQAITHVNPDGSTNIKGVYKDKDGLVIIRFNEVEDWEAIGFAEGSVSKGYTSADDERETGNIKFFIHGLEYANQLSKFDAFSLVDSDALLSVSYAEAVETKYRFFRSQGVILDVDTKYIHGGGETDSGSGYGKNINEFKNNYAYKGSERHSDRIFIADMVKRATGMSDKEYIEFVKANANKPMSEIEPAEIRDKIIKEFATINSRTRRGDRSYNEMYISNPSEVMGVFAYSQNDNIGPSATEFVERNNERLGFLKQYALERNIPLVIFGD